MQTAGALIKQVRSGVKALRNLFWLKSFIIFIIFEFIFTGIVMPPLIFYGPFENVKKTLIGSAYFTLRHRYIVEFFLTPQAIKNIMGEDVADEDYTPVEDKPLDSSVIKHEDGIDYIEVESKTFKGHVLVIHDPLKVKLVYSGKLDQRLGETTSEIARRYDALAAINAGGFYDPEWTGTGGTPAGFIIHEGEVVWNDQSMTKKQDAIAITEDGNLIVGRYSVRQLLDRKVREGVCFGPPLVVQGKGTIKKGSGGWGIAPRTAIGQRKSDGAIIFLAIDGRQFGSLGATLRDVQEIMLRFDAYTAANLDGGSSTTMYYEDRVINNPSDALGERAVPTVFVVTR